MTTWRKLEQRQHTRRDGARTVVDVWCRPCSACGRPFEVLCVPGATPERGRCNGFRMVHCPAHRLTVMQALERAHAALRAKREAKERALAVLQRVAAGVDKVAAILRAQHEAHQRRYCARRHGGR